MFVAAQDPDQLQFVLSRYSGFSISGAVLQAVVSGRGWHNKSAHLEVFFNHDPALKISQGSLSACLKARSSDYLELLLQPDPKLAVPSDLPSILIDQY